MKRLLVFLGAFLTIMILVSSCGNRNSVNKENVKIEPIKQSLWTDSLKNKFITSNAKTKFEKFVLTELISENEYSKKSTELEEYIHTQDFDNYKSSKSRNFIVVVDPLAGKSKKEVEKLIGKPNSKEVIHPSGIPGPCDKYNYIYNLIEIVYINGKADWITINNSSEYVLIYNASDYQSADWFSDYAYVKVHTK